MTKYGLLLLICLSGAALFAQRSDDFHLRYRPSFDPSVFSPEDLKQLSAQGATIDGIMRRLDAIDKNLEGIHATLDKEILPTIHVMDFFKWLFGAIIVAIIGAVTAVLINEWAHRRRIVSTKKPCGNHADPLPGRQV